MKKLCQRDKLWGSEKLGNTNYTVARYGCTITCISMATDYFSKFKGEWRSPAWLARKLTFTNGGLIVWGSMKPLLNCRLSLRSNVFSKSIVNEALKNPHKAVLLQVDNYHWVIAVSNGLLGLYAVDPWTGEKIKVLKRYNKITGIAVLSLN